MLSPQSRLQRAPRLGALRARAVPYGGRRRSAGCPGAGAVDDAGAGARWAATVSPPGLPASPGPGLGRPGVQQLTGRRRHRGPTGRGRHKPRSDRRRYRAADPAPPALAPSGSSRRASGLTGARVPGAVIRWCGRRSPSSFPAPLTAAAAELARRPPPRSTGGAETDGKDQPGGRVFPPTCSPEVRRMTTGATRAGKLLRGADRDHVEGQSRRPRAHTPPRV